MLVQVSSLDGVGDGADTLLSRTIESEKKSDKGKVKKERKATFSKNSNPVVLFNVRQKTMYTQSKAIPVNQMIIEEKAHYTMQSNSSKRHDPIAQGIPCGVPSESGRA